jgi:hypothetical protein
MLTGSVDSSLTPLIPHFHVDVDLVIGLTVFAILSGGLIYHMIESRKSDKFESDLEAKRKAQAEKH